MISRRGLRLTPVEQMARERRTTTLTRQRAVLAVVAVGAVGLALGRRVLDAAVTRL